MSESVARVREPIDLEEFERRLRGPAPQPREQKSLDELARLLEGQEAEQRLQAPVEDYAQALAVSRKHLADSLDAMSQPFSPPPQPRAEPNPFTAMGAPQVRPPAPRVEVGRPSFAPFERTPADRMPVERQPAQRPAADLDGYPIDAMARPGSGMGLRGSISEPEPLDDLSAMLRQYPDAGDRFASAVPPVEDAPQMSPQQWDGVDDQFEAAPPARGRSRVPIMLLGGAVAVCVLGVGATMWMRSGHSDPRGAPTIAAATGPVKVQPETPKAGETAGQSASILDRNGSERLAASRVVTREEQPVDIREAARTAARSETPPPRPVPGPNSGAQPNGLPTAGPAANGFFPEPRRVRTVSVRPDGTIISDAQPSRAAAPTPPQRPAAPAAAPTPVRPVGPGASNNAPPRPPGVIPSAVTAPPAVAATPTKVTARATANAPVATNDDEAPPARVRTAALAPAPATTASTSRAASGSYEVQIAAPGSEREARAVIASARQKFGSVLGGMEPTVRKATVGDREIYRVRLVGMSQQSATDLCGKLKSSGGSCFVARN